MNGSFVRKVLLVGVVLLGAGLVLHRSPLSIGQDKKVEKSAESKPEKKAAKGKLPAYYADVVSGEQREKIYAIQAKYDSQVKDLNAQLAALAKKINDEIEEVLTDEQKEKVKAARDKAVEAKKKKAADKKAQEAKGESAAKAN
jgi:predicted transcriptional regulator